MAGTVEDGLTVFYYHQDDLFEPKKNAVHGPHRSGQTENGNTTTAHFSKETCLENQASGGGAQRLFFRPTRVVMEIIQLFLPSNVLLNLAGGPGEVSSLIQTEWIIN
jgi:hypothetical protein